MSTEPREQPDWSPCTLLKICPLPKKPRNLICFFLFSGVLDDAPEEDLAVERRQLVGQRARRPRRLPQGEVPSLLLRPHHVALRGPGIPDLTELFKTGMTKNFAQPILIL